MTFHEYLPLQSTFRSESFPAYLADAAPAVFQPPERDLHPSSSVPTVAQSASRSFRCPSSRHQSRASTCRAENPNSTLRSVHGVPPTFDGLLRSRTLQAYFIPQPCSGFTLQGFNLQCRAVLSCPQPVPSCRSRRHPPAETVELCLPTPPATEVTPEELVSSSGLCSLHQV